MRRFGVAIAPTPKYQKILEKRPAPPGQHGARRTRAKIGAYGQRLFEKQKLRAFYSVSERQMRRYVTEASRQSGPTGANLLRLLETRLDALVYRLGLAPTIWAARQLVGHGHVRVDGRRVDIPSYGVRPGQTIALSERIKKSAQVVEWFDRMPATVPPYLELDRANMSGKLVRAPEREEIPVPINDLLIVEYYAR